MINMDKDFWTEEEWEGEQEEEVYKY